MVARLDKVNVVLRDRFYFLFHTLALSKFSLSTGSILKLNILHNELAIANFATHPFQSMTLIIRKGAREFSFFEGTVTTVALSTELAPDDIPLFLYNIVTDSADRFSNICNLMILWRTNRKDGVFVAEFVLYASNHHYFTLVSQVFQLIIETLECLKQSSLVL